MLTNFLLRMCVFLPFIFILSLSSFWLLGFDLVNEKILEGKIVRMVAFLAKQNHVFNASSMVPCKSNV